MIIRKISKKHLLDDYRQLKRALGRQPTCLEFSESHHSIATLCAAFGKPGWRKLLAAVGDKPKRKLNATRGMLIRAYHTLKKKLGRRPLSREYEKACYGLWIINRLFGKPGWRRLVEAAGDKLPDINHTAEHLIADFLELQQKLGRRPKFIEYRNHCHAPKVLDRVFGKPGWRRFLQALGKKAMPRRLLSTEHLIQDYLETRMVLGREPSYCQFHRRHRHSLKTINRAFGESGWKRLQKAADSARRAGATVRPVQRKLRGEDEIIAEIRATYHALLSGRLTDSPAVQSREQAQTPAWKLRNRLDDLFHELGHAVSLEEAFAELHQPAKP